MQPECGGGRYRRPAGLRRGVPVESCPTLVYMAFLVDRIPHVPVVRLQLDGCGPGAHGKPLGPRSKKANINLVRRDEMDYLLLQLDVSPRWL